MEEKIELLSVADIVRIYKLPRSVVYEMLHTTDCPIIKGRHGKRFLIERGAFEKWLKRK